MAIDKIFNNSSIDDLADNVLSEVDDFMLSVEKMQKRKVAGNVQLVIQALKKIDADIREKYDGVTTVIEKRVSTIKDGKDGQNGANGRDGKDGRPGRDGSIGPRGVDGLNGSNGRDGEDGVSVTNAFIDFDGSLVINLSDGQSLNVGEVVAPDLAEKIKVITNGGGTSQGVLDTLTSLQNQINLISSALVYKGTWNASTNTPALASGVGTANSFYIVSVAGSTTLNGISNWGVGDWATFNGTAWQRVEGGAAGNFTTLTTSGAATIQSLTVGRGGGGWSDSTAVGVNALFANTTGISNTAVGYLTLTSNLTGNRNTAVGSTAGYNISGSDNTAVGNTAGFSNTTGSRNVMLGNFAGAYELGSDSFYVDSRDRTNTAGDKAGALLYGTFSATPASQTLKINAALTATYDVTLSAGTANGVTYLNGSKVLTTGSALTFDGTTQALSAATGYGFFRVSGASGGYFNTYNNSGTNIGSFGSENGGDMYLGTRVNNPIIFLQNNSEQMRLTSTGLGIGTSSPQWKLDVQTTQSRFQVRDGANTGGTSAGTGLVSINATATALDSFNYRATVHAFIIDSTEAMRLTSTGLGIGTSSPAYKLDIGGTNPRIRINETTGYVLTSYLNTGGSFDVGRDNSAGLISGTAYAGFLNVGGAYPLIFNTNSAERMRLDSSGNLGLGVTPSAWDTYKSFELGQYGYISSGASWMELMMNTYYGSGTYRYKGTGQASHYLQQSGTHQWYTAPSGTAGDAITFTQALTLTSDGNLVAGSTTTSFRINATVASGADRDIFGAQISGASNGFTVKWNHSTTTTRVNIQNLPTSSAGLAAGDLYVLAGALMVA